MLRPKNMKYYSSTPHEGCLCVYCVKIRHKLISLKNSQSDQKLCNFPSTEYELHNKYQYWEKEEYTTKNGIIHICCKLLIKNETAYNCINSPISDMGKQTRSVTFIRHYFTLKWQYSKHLRTKKIKTWPSSYCSRFSKN